MTPQIRLSCELLHDAGFLAAGPDAAAIWIKGLLYAKIHDTGGFIPQSILPLLCVGVRGKRKAISLLIDLGFWVERDGGYAVGPKYGRIVRLALEGEPAAVRRKQREAIAGKVTELMRYSMTAGASCNRCGATSRLSIDHIIPISRGGMTVPENLQVLCRRCNSSKGNRL